MKRSDIALITDLDTIQRLAQARHDEFEVMRYMLELRDDISDEAIDSLIDEIAAPIIEAIDCTQCANCCRVLDVYLTPDDANRIDNHVDVSLDAIIDHETAAQVDEWGQFRQQPCGFLNGKLCSIYVHRPATCRTYPVFTPDFRWTLQDTIEGAAICPIIYNVLSAVVEKVDDL